MSFAPSEEESGEFRRKHCNPEDITNDGKPRFVKIRKMKKNAKKKVEDLELNREKSSLTDIEGFKEEDEDKSRMLDIIADLASENIVLLGKSRIDDNTAKELLKKNEEWESWKRERNIKKWIPKQVAKGKKDKFAAFTPISKKKGSTKLELMLTKALPSNNGGSKDLIVTSGGFKPTKLSVLTPQNTRLNILS